MKGSGWIDLAVPGNGWPMALANGSGPWPNCHGQIWQGMPGHVLTANQALLNRTRMPDENVRPDKCN